MFSSPRGERCAKRAIFVIAALSLGTLLLSACGSGSGSADTSGTSDGPVSGKILIDGSSTVFPITEAVAEEFNRTNRDVKLTVGVSGTGGGFTKFCNGETQINDASRAILPNEKKYCGDRGIEYETFVVGHDGIALMVNPKNDFVECLTTAELKKIWGTGSTVNSWNEVRPEFPDKPIKLYAPDADSGTLDFFTEVINGGTKVIRSDYTASADDNVLVQGIAGDDGALGYFGMAYYEENTDKLKLIGVDNGKGCVKSSKETVLDKTYEPLSRPLYLYVTKTALAKPEVKAFVRFYLENAPRITDQVGYVPAPAEVYTEGLSKIK